MQLKVIEYNFHLIAVEVSEGIGSWILVGFYGSPYAAKKQKVWEELCALLKSFKVTWVCIRDFNVILNDEEKRGGVSQGPRTIN